MGICYTFPFMLSLLTSMGEICGQNIRHVGHIRLMYEHMGHIFRHLGKTSTIITFEKKR